MSANPQSVAALSSVRPLLGGLMVTVARAFLDAGVDGLTCDEVEFWTGLKHQTASARVHDLSREGKILVDGRTRKTSSGREAAVYILSASGKRWLAEHGVTA